MTRPEGTATMPNTATDIEAEIARLKQRDSPEGRLSRYANGRVHYFVSRQILTLVGAAMLAIAAGPVTGLLALGIALLGEGVDCLFLRGLPARLQRGASLRRQRRIAKVTGAFQALTIATCILLTWSTAAPGNATFFFYAFLTGAALNGGLTMSYQRALGMIKLTVYAVTGLAILCLDLITSPALQPRHGYDAIGLLMMSYMTYSFVDFVNRSHRKARSQQGDLLSEQRRLNQVSLRLAEAQREAQTLSLVALHAHDNVILTKLDGTITWVNAAFTATTGYTAQEAMGQTLPGLLNGPETCVETGLELRDAALAGRAHRATILNYAKDGRKIWVETYLVPVPVTEGEEPVVISIERDVTKDYLNAKELKQASEKAEAASVAKSEFLATMSHEIRTPMNGVIGMADLLHDTELNPEQQHYCDTIRTSAAGLLTIINDILDFSRLDAGQMELSNTPFDLPACLTSATEILRPQAQAKSLALTLNLAPDLPQWTLGDDGRLRQILVNLLGNAVKFTTQGEVTVTASFAPEPKGAGTLTIAVADTGIGISPEAATRVFNQFEQADGAITRRFGGTGLGLAISRRLARAMGGDITLRSQPEKGSCFTLTTRLTPTKAPARAAQSPANGLHITPGLRVLVAEDNRTNQMLIKGLLKDQPVSLSFVENGEDAVVQTALTGPDLVFMDISMPKMDGLQATRAIRAHNLPQPVIVALTANAFAADKAACLDAGMDDFLSKPVRKPELLQKMIGIAPRPTAA
ncbi:response regulator [Alphaproteobacteria bacterium KMM 3653]|uniref:histidine kinase n=1 Tax=Harenicola maris TaxID=2841044 RepID=A0AAP2G7Z5_9RHOB|nr:response regulator [Harenicola maris]